MIIKTYRNHLARARNNISLALDFEGLTKLTQHREILIGIKEILDKMVSTIDDATKKAKTK